MGITTLQTLNPNSNSCMSTYSDNAHSLGHYSRVGCNVIGLVIGSCQNALGAILSSNVILAFVGFAYFCIFSVIIFIEVRIYMGNTL
jgi:hypothetical protein